MAASDLFVWLDALWNKSKPEGTFPTFVAHRFLASDPDMALLARELNVQVRDASLVFKIWQGYLPKGSGAPKKPPLMYVAAKKPPAEEKLVTRMKQVLGERREIVEQIIVLIKQAGRESDLYHEFGVEAPK